MVKSGMDLKLPKTTFRIPGASKRGTSDSEEDVEKVQLRPLRFGKSWLVGRESRRVWKTTERSMRGVGKKKSEEVKNLTLNM
jgi:hypothetical protein